MEEGEVNALRRNYCRLIRDLDAKEVIDNLYETHALSEDDVQNILDCSTSREQNRKLLYILRHRPPDRKSFNKFCCALDEYYNDLAAKIRRSCESGKRPSEHEHRPYASAYGSGPRCSPIEHAMATRHHDLPGCTYQSCDSWRRNGLISPRSARGKDEPDGFCAEFGASGPIEGEQVTSFVAPSMLAGQTHQYHDGSYPGNMNKTLETIAEYDITDGPSGARCSFYDYHTQAVVPFNSASHGQVVPKHHGFEFGDDFLHDRRRLDVEDEDECDPVCEELDAMFAPMALVPAHGGRQFRDIRLRYVFDRLSNVINKGEFERFYHYRNELLQLRPGDADLTCIMLYLESCTYLFLQNEEKCEETTDNALMLIPATSAPSRFLVEILSLKCWLCLKNNRLNVLQDHLADAFQVIHQDPMTCAGKSAGWMHVNEARRLVPMLTGSDVDRSQRLRNQAISHYEKSLDHFKSDISKDGPFGYHFALIKLSQLRLACGDYMQTTDLQPTEEEMLEAEMRLREVEESPIGLPKILKMNYCQARSDLCFRKHNIPRALDYAEEACDIARAHQCVEELRYNTARVNYLESLLTKAGPFTSILAKKFDDELSYSEAPTKSSHCKRNVYKKRRSDQSLDQSQQSHRVSIRGCMNAALGIIAILVLGGIVIWQSLLLQKQNL